VSIVDSFDLVVLSVSSIHCNQLLARGIHKCYETRASKCLQLLPVCIV
jgi:hypothetical protein